jgi:hypothetical protein
MEIETRSVCSHPIAPAAKQTMQREVHLLCREVPQGNLDRLVKRQAIGPLVAAARSIDPVRKSKRCLTFHFGPDLESENTGDFFTRRQGTEKALHKAQADAASIIDEFKGRHVDIVGPHLTVSDHPIAGELKPGKTKLNDSRAHSTADLL